MKKIIEDISKELDAQTSVDDLLELCNCIKNMNASIVVEIGVATGATLKLWNTLLDKDGLLVGIDAHNHMAWKPGESTCKTIFIYGDSKHKEVKGYLEYLLRDKKGVDFLYIDGSHDYESVKSDYEMYSPLVRKGGLIAFHDVISSIDVKKFILELEESVSKMFHYIPLGKIRRNIAYFYKEN